MRHVKRVMPAHLRACVRPMEDLSINARLGALAVSQDGSLIVVGLARSVVVLREEHFEERWLKGPNPNMSDHAIVAQLGNLENDVSVVQISANNATVAAAGKEENWAAVMHLVDGSAEVSALYMTRDTQIHGIALSPDGQFVSMTGRDRRATVYCISGSAWRPVYDFDLSVYLFAYGTCVQFSPSGDMLVVGGDMRKCTVWDVGPGQPPRGERPRRSTVDSRLLKVLGRGGYINAVCFDASGRTLALTGGDWKVALYDLASDFALIAEVVMPVQHQHGLAISFPSPPPPPGSPSMPSQPSGHPAFAGLVIAAQSGRESGVLTLTDMATLCPLCEIEGVNDVGFARGGLLYCRVGGAVHIYDINSSGDAIIPESRLGGRVRAMAPNHDGSLIALARMAVVRVYAAALHGVVDELTMPSDVVALAYSPSDTPSVRAVCRLLDRQQIPAELHARILHDSLLTGKLAALTAKRLLVFAGEPGQLAEVASVKLEHELPSKEEEARHALRWSSDGSMVAVGTGTHALLIDTHARKVVQAKRRDTDAWLSIFRLREQFGQAAAGFGNAAFYRESDVKEKQLKGLLGQLGAVRVQAYAMSHDCAHLAVGGNGRLFLFDTGTQEAVFELANTGWVMGLVWSADDRFVGIGGHNKTVTVLDVSSGVVFADCGVPRSYWPLVLAFSADGRVVADGNQSFAVYSCDGSRLALSKPLEASPMLRTSAPAWAEGGAHAGCGAAEKHEALLVGLVRAHPQIALNGLPTKNDGIYRDKGLQPLANGSARMLDVLIARHKRSLVGRLLEQMPALSLLPAGRQELPSFELAIRKRDLPTLHLLLLAATRAPLPLRRLVTSKVLPRLAAERLSCALGGLLCDPSVGLERSGALIALTASPADSAAYGLHPSWGGVGTRIWEALDAKREQPSAAVPAGVHVRPRRVPLPGLTSSAALRVLVGAECRGQGDVRLPVFSSPCVRAVVLALWSLQFARLGRRRVWGCVLHLLLFLLFSLGARVQPPRPGDASAASAWPPLLSGWPQAHLALALLLLLLNAHVLARALLYACGQPPSARRAALRARDATFGQTAAGAALVLALVGAEGAHRAAGALGLSGLARAVGLRGGLEPAACAAAALAARALVRCGLVAGVLALCERLLHSLRGIPCARLAVVVLSRAARSVLPMLLAGLVCSAVVMTCAPLLLGTSALHGSHLTALLVGGLLVLLNAFLHVCSSAHAQLEARRTDVELRAMAELIVDFYAAMAPQKRREAEAQWEWVHVLEAAADRVPASQLEQRRAPSLSLRAAEERLDRRIDDLDSKLSDLRAMSDRMSELMRQAR